VRDYKSAAEATSLLSSVASLAIIGSQYLVSRKKVHLNSADAHIIRVHIKEKLSNIAAIFGIK